MEEMKKSASASSALAASTGPPVVFLHLDR
jgi:hypothetical protein